VALQHSEEWTLTLSLDEQHADEWALSLPLGDYVSSAEAVARSYRTQSSGALTVGFYNPQQSEVWNLQLGLTEQISESWES
jgi:hypothetical protein